MSPAIYAAWVAAICGAVWAVFGATEAAVNQGARRKFSQTLLTLEPGQLLGQWPSDVLEIFGRIFGTKWASWRFFLRSSVASVFFFVVVTNIYIVASQDFGYQDLWRDSIAVFEVGVYYPYLPFLMNIGADYLSLAETLFMIYLLQNRNTLTFAVVVLCLDAVLTGALFVIWSILTVDYAAASLTFGFGSLRDELLLLWHGLVNVGAGLVMTLPEDEGGTRSLLHFAFYTTFLTSVWIWAYVGSLFAVKVAGALGVPWARIRSILDFESKPFVSMGYLACGAIIALAGLLFFIRRLLEAVTMGS